MTETPLSAVTVRPSTSPPRCAPSQPVAGRLQVADPRRHRGQPADRPAHAAARRLAGAGLHGARRLAAVVPVQAQLPRRQAQRDPAADRPRTDRRSRGAARRARAAPARRLLAAGRPSRQGLGAAGAGLARQSRGDRPLSRPGRAPAGSPSSSRRRSPTCARRATRTTGIKAPARPSCRRGRASCRKAIARRGPRPRHRSRG